MNASRFTSISDNFTPMLGASLAYRTLIEVLLVAGAVMLVAVALLVWVVFFRRARKRKRVHHHHHRRAAEIFPPGKLPESKRSRSRHKRSQSEFPRLPTLAETGGLPPVRHPPASPTDSPPN